MAEGAKAYKSIYTEVTTKLDMARFVLVLAVVVGVFAGVGAYTFKYAEGLSYFSTDPKVCVNCHIMRDEYDSWRKGPHHGAAVCADCHLPHDLVDKYIAKATNGYRHSKGFTFQDFHEPIMIKPRNAQILQENCLRCHGDFVYQIVQGSKTGADAVKCVHCHATAGHGSRK